MKTSKRLTSLLLIAMAGTLAHAGEKTREKQNPSLLTVARIFDSKDFNAESFSARLLDDGSGYLTLAPSTSVPGGQDIVRHFVDPGRSASEGAASGGSAPDRSEILVSAALLIPPGESSPLRIQGYSFSKDRSLVMIYTNSKRVWRRNTRGDYWVLDRAARQLHRLGGDAQPSTLMFAKFSPDGRYAAYVREKNIYLEDLRSGRIVPLTTSDSPDVSNGTSDWVYEEELDLRDGFRWSPDSRSIAYWQIDARGVPVFPLVNQTDSLYPRVRPIRYPKVGQQNSVCRVGVVDIHNGKTTWVAAPGDPRAHYIARLDWAAGSKEVLFQQLNRLQNANRVMLADARSGKIKTVLTERDDAWVDVHDELQWLSDGEQFTWISERDGWRHVYLVSRDGTQTKLITPGPFDVIRMLSVDEKQGWLYFLASPDNPTQCYLYRVDLDGTDCRRLTPREQSGSHSYQISSDGRWAIHSWSSFGVPPTTELIRLPDHHTLRTLVDNKRLRQQLARLKQGSNEFFRVDIGNDLQLDAWCIKPPHFDPAKKYPLLIYVYGEPAGQTVVDHWGGTGYLWHLMLAQRGYLVMSFDNRGTKAPRGRAWRKVIYRQVGILAPREQAAALKSVLAQRSYVDPNRVGIWGWSGGGSMSLNAIFRYPDLYQTAMAVAAVANQRYYDTIYQERYMGLPGDNVEGFIQGSPITYAHNLKGNLLIVHGTGDDNCHYQTTETLINELIRCDKPFTMMAYPNRTHSIREGPNTTRHLRELLTRYLMEHLPPGPVEGKDKPCKNPKRKHPPRH